MNTMFRNILLSGMLLLSVCLGSYGQKVDYPALGMDITGGNIPQGLKEGDKAPGFLGYDQTGKQVELKNFLEKGPVVLFFYRGKWCPVCSRYLNDYQDSLKVIVDQGASVVAITPESIENVEQTVKLHNLTFTVIYDCQEKIMKDYDVMFSVTKDYQDKILSKYSINISENNGRDIAHLPVPATYIINREGIIVAVWFNPDYHKRASVKWIMNNLGKAF